MNINKELILNFCINLVALILVKVTLYFLDYGETLFDGLSIMIIIAIAVLFTYLLDYRKSQKTKSE